MQQSEYMAMMQGDDGTLGSTELIAAYEQGIDDLRSAVAGMTPEQVLARPVPGKWSTVECVGHLADTEIFFTDRIVRTIAMDRPLLMSADENLYIERLGYQSFDLDEQLALFTALRRHAVRILRMQPPEAWSRTPSTANRDSSPCGNWCCRPCGTCGTTCRSSPKSGRRWAGASHEHDPRTSRRLSRPLRKPVGSDSTQNLSSSARWSDSNAVREVSSFGK